MPDAEIGGDGAEPAGLDHAGNAGRERGNHVDGDLGSPHRHAGHDRGMLVAADREDVAAEPRPAQHKAGQQRQHEHVDHGVGDPEQPGAAAEEQQLVVIRTELEHHGVVGGDHREAARDRQHAQRDHERRDTQIGDQHAVDRADQQRRSERGGDADLDAVAGMHDDRENHAAQAQHRADRQIDAAGDDHHRHARAR